MPIRPENRDRYPKDWPAISTRICERAGNRCEFCDVPNHQLGKWIECRWHVAHPRGSEPRDWPRKDGRDYPCYHAYPVITHDR
jgi:hypothetical protein